MKFLVINGPNLNLLGSREPAIYGRQDYAYLCKLVQDYAAAHGSTAACFQSNHEGAIIDEIQTAEGKFDAIIINPGDKLICVIAIGYGISPGRAHKSRPAEELSNLSDASPDWFRRGVEAALLAPTAVNQQSFYLAQDGDSVALSSKGGPYSKIDLGIVKLHFELGAGKENFVWKEV